MTKNPLVSVNIRTFNSEKTIQETLESVANQTYPCIEIVISDGYSKDNTVDIAKKFGAVITYAKELGDARYKVFSASKGDYVLSLDSDQIMDKDLIEKCVKKCLKTNCLALIISEKSLVVKKTYLEKLISYDKYLIDKDRKGSEVLDSACPRFFQKNVLLSVVWPKKLSIFDDSILYAMLRKMRVKICYVNTASIWHHEVSSWLIFAKKFFRYGKGYFRALDVSPKVVVLHSLPRRAYFSKHVFDKPELILPLFFLYFIKISAASIGALISVFEKSFSKNINV